MAAAGLIGSHAVAQESASAKALVTPSKCFERSEALFGVAAQVGKSASGSEVLEPKKLKDVRPKLPSEWPKACKAPVFIHDVLISPSGVVVEVWPLRDSCPDVGAEVVVAIRQWRYEPARLKGKAVPICMTVRTGIEVR